MSPLPYRNTVIKLRRYFEFVSPNLCGIMDTKFGPASFVF